MANWKHASLIGVVFAVVLAGTGVGMYYLGFGNGQEKAISRPNIFQMLQDEISAEQIDISLKHLSSVPHLAGTPQDLEQAEWVRDRFLEAGLDETKIVPYEVLLSYPKKESPNKVYLLTEKGTQIFATSGTQPPLYAEEESSEDVLPNFNAYSAPGNVTADLVYVFFGREQDYEQLAARGVNVSGKIVLARYGAIFRGNIVSIAEKMGAVGAILYSDPQNYAQDGRTAVYNHSFWMPGLGVQSGSLFRTASPGDPLTPLYPSLSSAHRLDQLEADLPKIPVQPIGYNEAEIFLREMSKTNRAPDEWQGTLDTVYYMGPGFQTPGYKVKMEVHTSNQKAIIHNTIGILYGEEEPDRYVLVGNHRDAWTLGSIDPSSGTASMLEMARAFGVMKTNLNWRPRRSLVFCSWGAEEYALIGSYEWVEQHAKVLSQRAVAYLNVDIAVAGNQSLRARASPLLRTVLVESAKKVPNPNPTEVALGRNTVHDTWAFNFPDAQHPGEAKVDNLGSGSDHAAFMYSVGIPSMDFNYAYKPTITGAYFYPLYHTLYETHHLAGVLVDPGFRYHRAMTQLWAEVARNLSESAVLPFDVQWYADEVNRSLADLKIRYTQQLQSAGVDFDHFQKAADFFVNRTKSYVEDKLAVLDRQSSFAIRRINDQLMQLERHFIEPRGLPNRPCYNHIVFSPSSKDTYASATFSGLTDLLETLGDQLEDEQPVLWTQVKQHLALIAFYIEAAADSLTDML